MSRFARTATLALALAALSFGPQAAPDPHLLERLLPPDVLFYLSIPQSPAASQDYARSGLARFWEHPEIRAFRRPIERWWHRRKTEPVQFAGEVSPSWNDSVRQTFGLSIDEIWEILGAPLGFALLDLPVNEQHKIDLVVSLGAPDPARLRRALDEFKKTVRRHPNGNLHEGEFQHEGVTVHELGNDDFRFYLAFVENTLLVTTQAERMQGLISAAADRAFQGLRASASFAAARGHVAPENRHFLLSFLNTEAVLRRFRAEIGDEALKVIEALGLADVSAVALGLSYEGVWTRERTAVVTSRQDRGLLRFLAGRPAPDPFASRVPEGSLSYMHFRLDAPGTYDTLLSCTKVAPSFDESLTQGIRDLEKRWGLSLRDALATLGTAWTTYGHAPEGRGLFPDDLLMVELADPAGFEAALGKIARAEGIAFEEATFRGRTIRTLARGLPTASPFLPADLLDAGEDPFPFGSTGYAPCWFVEGNTLYFSSHPHALQRHILRSERPGRPIGEDPRFRTVAPRDGAESWYYLDVGRWVAVFYGLVEPFAHLGRDFTRDPQTGDLIVDLAQLPLGETLADLIGPMRIQKATRPDAIVVESVSLVPISQTVLIGGAAIVAAVAIPGIITAADRGNLPGAGIAANERLAEISLRFIRQAEETFKNSDSDRNGTADYWTRDVAGLYALKDRSGQAIFLLDPATAQADPEGAPRYGLTPAAKNGYHFRMLTTDPDGEPYAKDEDKDGQSFTNRKRFAVTAWPAQYGQTGRLTFLMGEDGRIWKKDTGGQPVNRWPVPTPAQDGWEAVE
ncbi:MAG TPA: DUF2950 family protein [Planctomycetota bacterium]|nr:DUF2950 family protein [Planctomycetota bacterium]